MAETLVEESMGRSSSPHVPVLLPEALEHLAIGPGSNVVDTTVGAGGHAEAILEATAPGGRLYGIDRDPEALAVASARLARFRGRFVPIHGKHEELLPLLRSVEVFGADAILADLGVSSLQLDDPSRGFSFRSDGPLDMRMDPTSGPTAADLLATLTEAELRRVLRTCGEERRAAAIARALVRARERSPIRSTGRLADLVLEAAGPGARRFRIHPATRTFQALRIAVNREVEGLERFVFDATSMLRPDGRLVMIAFHSLEDRAVKHAMRSLAARCVCPPDLPVCGCGRENLLEIVTAGAVRPSRDEAERNPRARSARLRAAKRVA